MRRYSTRLAWYFALVLISIGVFYLKHPIITGPFFSALGSYLLTSLFWGRALERLLGYSAKTFGIETELFWKSMVGIGLVICAVGFTGNHFEATVVGMIVVLSAMDGVAWARENKYSTR